MGTKSKGCLTYEDRPQHRLSAKEKALFAAVRKNDAAKVKELIAQGVNVNCLETPKRAFEFDITPLHEAAYNQNPDITRMLLEAGANPNAEVGHLQSIDQPGEPPLNWACGYRSLQNVNLEVVKLLLAYGGNPNHRMKSYQQSVFEASICKSRLEVIKALTEAGAEINPPGPGFCSPLIHASADADAEIVSYLIKKGANLDYQDPLLNTALIMASQRGNLEIVDVLLEAGAKLDLRNRDGQTGLMLAAKACGDLYVPDEIEKKFFPIVRKLVEAGADLNLIDNFEMTALDWAERNPLAEFPHHACNYSPIPAHFLEKAGAKRAIGLKTGES
jgi:ankyrin repeat protein